MRFATTATAAVMAASAAVAQLPIPSSGSGDLASQALSMLGQLSPQCQTTVFGLISSPIVSCLNIPQTISVLTSSFASSNASIIAPIDQLLAIDCASSGCSNSTLQSFAQNITTGCGSDLQKYNISNSAVTFAIAQYPLAREVACLRTSDYNSTSNSTNATIPLTSPPYNITNGTAFCATSLLTEVSQKVGTNLTLPFFVDLYKSYKNGSISQFATQFKPTDICNECIFAAADVIGVAYPGVGNLTLSSIGFNATGVSNITLSKALDGACQAQNLTWNSNGTLPANITLGAKNSTFGFNLTTVNGSYTPSASASPIAKRNVANIKARWVGQI